MRTKAVRLYGSEDLRLEEFELPEPGEDEILAEVVSDSACMSTYKAYKMGPAHKRVPDDVAGNPVIVGHEFCGKILRVGRKWQGEFEPGERFSIQPAMNYRGSLAAPGYSYPNIGGDATYVVIPNEVMETGCLLRFSGDAYFYGSLAEPLSCVIGAFKANYHVTQGSYVHRMGIVPGGSTAILAGVGPMGLAAIEYALEGPVKPKLLAVTGGYTGNDSKLRRAEMLYPPEKAAEKGVEIVYINGSEKNYTEKMKALTGGRGFDDVFCMAPVKQVVEEADSLLAKDGCLNFFAGPADPDFRAEFNFFNVHYAGTHVVGTSGGNNDDLRDAIDLLGRGVIDPAAMVTHIGGLGAVIGTIGDLPSIPGGKKLIYTHSDLPLISLRDLGKYKDRYPVCGDLDEIVRAHGGLWCAEAEKRLLRETGED